MKPAIKRNALIYALFATMIIGSLAKDTRALDPNTKDARKIAEAVEGRDTGDKEVSKVSMTLVDDSNRKRKRVLHTKSLKFDGGTKMIMLFESPANMRNTGLLSIDHDDGNKDDDQWLYLPSLRKATRISTSDKSGSFLGTDITYSDMTKKDIDAYDYKLIADSVMVDGDECWLIESRPRTDKEKTETGYLKIHSWISKSKLIVLQAKMWVQEGRKLKYMKSDDVRKVNGIWKVHKLTVRSMKNKKTLSTTVMKYLSLKLDQASVTDAQFTERRLEQGI